MPRIETEHETCDHYRPDQEGCNSSDRPGGPGNGCPYYPEEHHTCPFSTSFCEPKDN